MSRRLFPVSFLLLVLMAFGCSDDESSSSSDVMDQTEDLAEDLDEDTEEDVSDTGDTADTDPDADPDMEPDTDTVEDTSDTTDTADTEEDMTMQELCPETVPAQGANCPRDELLCEYGDDPRRDCRLRATCTVATGWDVAVPMCDPLPMVECPASREAAAGVECDTLDSYCDYDGLICHCTNCVEFPVQMCSGPLLWNCEAPNEDMDCPEARPRLGSLCDNDGLLCKYECGPTGATECTDGVWTEAAGDSCPISTRRVKTDIDYLTPGEVEAVSEELLNTKLATWRYTDPALKAGTHLGFIIEDMPADSPAVVSNGQMVDLYGYTSMLVATTQRQQATIEALEQRLQNLEQRMEKECK